jgi:hypothetical protein
MHIDSRNSSQFPGINYERCIKYISTPPLDPRLEPIKGWESKAVNPKALVKPRKMRSEEDENPLISSYKKLGTSWLIQAKSTLSRIAFLPFPTPHHHEDYLLEH